MKEAQEQVAAEVEVVNSHIAELKADLLETVPDEVERTRLLAAKMSRRMREFPAYANLFAELRLPNLITSEEYDMINFENPTIEERYAVVLPSMIEATRILKQGPVRRTMIIRGARDPSLTIASFLHELEGRTTVDVQDQDAPIGVTKGAPQAFSGKDTARRFKEPNRHDNLLNLECTVANPTPCCVAKIPSLNILANVKDDNNAGKKARTKIRDLTNCATFHVCARCGAHSLLHHDSYGKVTTVFCEEGEKAWPCCPTFTDSELQAWKVAQEHEDGLLYRPSLKLMFLYLGPGDLIIMPSNTPHAPYTMTDCLMTGTQHFHSETILDHINAGISELDCPNITNEEPSTEAVAKFKAILRLWDEGNLAYKFPGFDVLKTAKERLKVCKYGICLCIALTKCQELEKKMKQWHRRQTQMTKSNVQQKKPRIEKSKPTEQKRRPPTGKQISDKGTAGKRKLRSHTK